MRVLGIAMMVSGALVLVWVYGNPLKDAQSGNDSTPGSRGDSGFGPVGPSGPSAGAGAGGGGGGAW